MLTCNWLPPAVIDLGLHMQLLSFSRPKPIEVCRHVSTVCANRRLPISATELEQLIQFYRCDIRAILMALQCSAATPQHRPEVTLETSLGVGNVCGSHSISHVLTNLDGANEPHSLPAGALGQQSTALDLIDESFAARPLLNHPLQILDRCFDGGLLGRTGDTLALQERERDARNRLLDAERTTLPDLQDDGIHGVVNRKRSNGQETSTRKRRQPYEESENESESESEADKGCHVDVDVSSSTGRAAGQMDMPISMEELEVACDRCQEANTNMDEEVIPDHLCANDTTQFHKWREQANYHPFMDGGVVSEALAMASGESFWSSAPATDTTEDSPQTTQMEIEALEATAQLYSHIADAALFLEGPIIALAPRGSRANRRDMPWRAACTSSSVSSFVQALALGLTKRRLLSARSSSAGEPSTLQASTPAKTAERTNGHSTCSLLLLSEDAPIAKSRCLALCARVAPLIARIQGHRFVESSSEYSARTQLPSVELDYWTAARYMDAVETQRQIVRKQRRFVHYLERCTLDKCEIAQLCTPLLI